MHNVFEKKKHHKGIAA